jgi:hypothetical protein
MGAGEHVDAVDLVQAEPLDDAAKPGRAGRRRPARAEALRRQRDPARGGGGEGVQLTNGPFLPPLVIPAKAGISLCFLARRKGKEIPAFAGMTGRESLASPRPP